MIAGTLEIQLLADLARLRKEMEDAKRLIGNAVQAIQRSANNAKAALGGMAAGLLGALSVGVFTAWIKGAIDAGDAAGKLAAKTGLMVKDVAGVQLAYQLAGLEGEALTTTIGKLSKGIVDGNKGLEALGIKTRDAGGAFRDTKSVLYDVADAIQALPDGVQKTALAMEVFGKSGAEMIPLLNGGSAGMREMAEMAEKLGLVISEGAQRESEKFNDTLDLLAMGGQGVARGIAAELLPTLSNLAGSFLESMTSGNALRNTANFIGSALKALYTVGVGVVQVFSTMGKVWGGVVGAVLAAMSGDFKVAKNILGEMITDVGTGWVSTAKAISTAWSTESNAAVESQASILKGQKDLLGAQKEREESAKQAAANAKKRAKEAEDAAKAELDLVKKVAAERSKSRNDEYGDIEKYLAEQERGRIATVQAANDAVRAAQEEYDNHGKTKSQIAEVTLARLNDKLTAVSAGSAIHQSILQEIEAQKELIGILRQGEMRDASEKSAADAAAEWKKTSESIEQSLTDALLRGFESGKGFGRNLIDTLKNMFQTLVLRPVISAIVNPVAGAIGGSLGLASGVAEAAGSSGGLSGAGSLLSGASALAGNFGAGISAGFAQLTSGVGLSSFASGTAAVGANSMATALGQVAGYLGPIALGIGALVAIAKMTKGETRAGGQYGYSFNGATVVNNRRGETMLATGIGAQFLEGPSGGDPYAKEAKAAINGTVQSINAVLKAVGSQASLIGFQAAYETSGKGRGGVFAGGRLSTGAAFGESGEGSNYDGTLYESTSTTSPDAKTAIANFATDLKQVTIQALQAATDIPQTIADVIRNIDAESLTDEAAGELLATIDSIVTGVNELNASVKLLPFDNLSGLSFDAAANLVKLAGGIQGLASGTAFFTENFYTEAERLVPLTAMVTQTMADLGHGAVTTREGFRAVVEGLDLATESDAKLYVELMKVAPAFLTVADAATAAADASTAAAEAAKAVAQAERERQAALAGDKMQQIIRLTELAGDAAGVLALRRQVELGAMDESLRPLQLLIYAREDEIAAAERAATAASNAKAAYQTLVDGAQTAFNALARAIENEKKLKIAAYTQASDALVASMTSVKDRMAMRKSLLDALDGALKRMVAPWQEQFDRTNAQAQIATALAIAKASGVLPDAGALEGALGIVSNDAAGLFASFEDYQRDFYKTGNDIRALAELTDNALTVDERQLVALEAQKKALDQGHAADLAAYDAQLALAQEALDKLNGIDNSILSVAEALKQFAAAILAAKTAAPAPVPTAPASPTPASGGVSLPAIEEYGQQYGGSAYYLIPGVNDYAAKLAGVKMTASLSGMSLAEAWKAVTGFPEAYWLEVQRQWDAGLHPTTSSIPGFANGGLHAGGWRMVGERGPELEYTGPSRIFNASDTTRMLAGNGTAELTTAMGAMLREMERLTRAAEGTERQTRRQADMTEVLSEGGQRFRVIIEEVGA